MFASTLTPITNAYDTIRTVGTSTLRRVAGLPDTDQLSMTISHEETSKGIRGSVVIFDNTKVIGSLADGSDVKDTVRVMLKVQYKPLSGRTDTTADIGVAIDELKAFLTGPNLTKLLNMES